MNMLGGAVFLVLDLLGLNFCIFINKLYKVFYLLRLKLIFCSPYYILGLAFSLYVKHPIVSMVNLPDNLIVKLFVGLIISAVLSYFFRTIYNYFNLNKIIVLFVISKYILLKEYVQVYFKACVMTGYTMLCSSLYIPYNRNKYIMVAHTYRYGNYLFNQFEAKYRADLLLLQDQCQTLQNALPHIDANSPWSDIFTEHVRRVQQEQIPSLERHLAKFRNAHIFLDEDIMSAHARGKSLSYDFKTLESTFV